MSLPQVPWWRDSGPLHYQQASHPHHGAVPGEDVREQLGTVAPGDHASSVPAGGPSPLGLLLPPSPPSFFTSSEEIA